MKSANGVKRDNFFNKKSMSIISAGATTNFTTPKNDDNTPSSPFINLKELSKKQPHNKIDEERGSKRGLLSKK